MDFKWFQLQIIAITFYYPFFLWFILYYTMIDECCGTYMYLHHAYSSHSSHSSDSSDSPLHCFHMISTVCDFHTISICSDPICTCAAVLCGVEVPGRVPERWRFAEAMPQEISRPRIPIVSSTCPILSYLYTEKKRSTLCKLYIVILMTIFQK